MLVLLFLEAAAVPTAFTSSNTLRTAFADWCDASKRGSTEAAHGPISDWDVSGVNSLYELYSAVPQTHRHTCNPDISRWDVSNVINMRSARLASASPPRGTHPAPAARSQASNACLSC